MGARKATATARVTVTIPSDLVPGIDRIEKNLTRFILETVRHEIQHRRRQEPLRSLRHPHPETAEPAELGPGKWAHQLPRDDRATLVALGGGRQSVGARPGLGRRERVTRDRGAVILVDLDPTTGHEERGVQPCVIVGAPEVTLDQRFPPVCVTPVTSTSGRRTVPGAAPGPSGLRVASWALVDQLRSVDKRRLRRVCGVVAGTELEAMLWSRFL